VEKGVKAEFAIIHIKRTTSSTAQMVEKLKVHLWLRLLWAEYMLSDMDRDAIIELLKTLQNLELISHKKFNRIKLDIWIASIMDYDLPDILSN
jgi:hypothetical protein